MTEVCYQRLHFFGKNSSVKIVQNSPVAPIREANRLNDEDHHLAEEHKEEGEEAERAVSPTKEKKCIQTILGDTYVVNTQVCNFVRHKNINFRFNEEINVAGNHQKSEKK